MTDLQKLLIPQLYLISSVIIWAILDDSGKLEAKKTVFKHLCVENGL